MVVGKRMKEGRNVASEGGLGKSRVKKRERRYWKGSILKERLE